MKLPWESKNKSWGVTAFLTIAASIIFFLVLYRWDKVAEIIGLFTKSLAPITYGLILAYLLNPLVNVIERSALLPLFKKIFRKNKKRAAGFARGVSIFFAWVASVVFVVVIFALIIPELYSSIETLISKIPEYSAHIVEEATKILKENPEIVVYIQDLTENFSTDFTKIMTGVKDWIPNLNVMITGLTDSVWAVVSVFFNILVGIIVSVYVLKDKEKFVAQFKKLFYSTMSYKKANNTIAFWRLTHDKFGNFITGKIFDSLIIGVICFIILIIANIPYAALISVIVGVTNVIPFFGPFIGAIPSAFLVLLVDPLKCITFVIIIILLQQFDGNILGPKILGDTTGVSSFWVVFSIMLGSGLFGVVGMVCSVPVFAVFYTLVKDGCHIALRKKGIDYSTETFEKIDHIDEDTKAPKWINK